jgi:DNA-binding NtrC family response regulator
MTQKRVLVIDDEDSVRKILCDNLRLSGLDVAAAASADEGLALLVSDPPGVLITDIIMPGKSGLDVIAAVRKSHPQVRILAISGGGRIKENDDLLEKALTAGAEAVLAKPLDLDEFERTVFRLLEAP